MVYNDLEALNPYYQAIADALVASCGGAFWGSLLYVCKFYVDDGSGQEWSSDSFEIQYSGKKEMVVPPMEMLEIIPGLRAAFEAAQGQKWTIMTFKLSNDGEMEVDFGYEDIQFE